VLAAPSASLRAAGPGFFTGRWEDGRVGPASDSDRRALHREAFCVGAPLGERPQERAVGRALRAPDLESPDATTLACCGGARRRASNSLITWSARQHANLRLPASCTSRSPRSGGRSPRGELSPSRHSVDGPPEGSLGHPAVRKISRSFAPPFSPPPCKTPDRRSRRLIAWRC
jgi:hypothetical protein